MDVGHGATVSDEWIPKGIPTGILDIEGIEIRTRDRVSLNGCTSRYAIVGTDTDGTTLMLLFGREDGMAVGWFLDEKTVIKNKVRVEK